MRHVLKNYSAAGCGQIMNHSEALQCGLWAGFRGAVLAVGSFAHKPHRKFSLQFKICPHLYYEHN